MPEVSGSQGPDLVAHLRRQSLACGDLGSLMYSALMERAADDLAAGGPLADVLAGWRDEPGPAALALRLFGTLHRLALTGQAPELARYYPSVTGTAALPFDAAGAWAACQAILRERGDDVRAGLGSPPQTNEIGRSAALIGGLLILRRRIGLPVRLVEIGASAGLNLRPDQVRVDVGQHEHFGPAMSPVVLDEPWRGAIPPVEEKLEIISRLGSDVDPVDVSSAPGRIRLTSYVWPDQGARLARLRGAFALAAAMPIEVAAGGAAETVAALAPAEGSLTVVWHSVLWQYLPWVEREALTGAFDALGAAASPSAPVARLSLEPTKRFPLGVEFVIRLQTWPGRGVEMLGSAHPHGDTVVWRRV